MIKYDDRLSWHHIESLSRLSGTILGKQIIYLLFSKVIAQIRIYNYGDANVV